MDPAPSSPPPNSEEPAYRVFLDSLDYLPAVDVERIKEAYAFSARAHANQKRMSGEPYITHPLAVAGAVVEWRMDADAVAAALREAEEEIGLPRRQVEVLGRAEAHETVTGYLVTPVFARIRGDFTPVPEAGEVEEVFSVPLSHAANPARYRIEGRPWRGQVRRYYAVPYGPYYIWGATARILRALADRMAE